MTLNDYKNKKRPFSTPEGYFEELEKNILHKSCGTVKRNCTPCKPRRNIAVWSKWVSFAAMVAIVALIAIATHDVQEQGNDNKQGKNTYAGVNNKSRNTQTSSEIDAEYIDNMLSSYPIDDYTFYSCLTGY